MQRAVVGGQARVWCRALPSTGTGEARLPRPAAGIWVETALICGGAAGGGGARYPAAGEEGGERGWRLFGSGGRSAGCSYSAATTAATTGGRPDATTDAWLRWILSVRATGDAWTRRGGPNRTPLEEPRDGGGVQLDSVRRLHLRPAALVQMVQINGRRRPPPDSPPGAGDAASGQHGASVYKGGRRPCWRCRRTRGRRRGCTTSGQWGVAAATAQYHVVGDRGPGVPVGIGA